MRIQVVDRNAEKVTEFERIFAELDYVSVHCGDVFDFPADAVVSPANSFGDMQGGVDLAYALRWPSIPALIQQTINEMFPFGELLIGQAFHVRVVDDAFHYLIVAPTMRIPMKVPPCNAYLATRAAVWEAYECGFESITITGMATGDGGLNATEAGNAMKKGMIDAVSNYRPHNPLQWGKVTAKHLRLAYD